MNFTKSFSFNQLVGLTMLRNEGKRVNTKYRKAYWTTLNEKVKCKPPFVPTAEHNQLMLEVEQEISRLTEKQNSAIIST